MTDPATDYLRRLDAAAAWQLPPDRRQELVDGIAEHIRDACDSGAVTTEAQLRDLLDRLGAPEAIVATARHEEFGPPPAYAAPVSRARRAGRRRLPRPSPSCS